MPVVSAVRSRRNGPAPHRRYYAESPLISAVTEAVGTPAEVSGGEMPSLWPLVLGGARGSVRD